MAPRRALVAAGAVAVLALGAAVPAAAAAETDAPDAGAPLPITIGPDVTMEPCVVEAGIDATSLAERIAVHVFMQPCIVDGGL